MNKEIEIPEGYEARIEGNKVILEPKESEDERIRKELLEEIEFIIPHDDETDSEGLILPSYHARIDRYKSYLEKQKEQKPESCDCSRDEESYMNGIHHVLMNPEAYGLIKQKPLSTEETKLNSITFLEQRGYTCIPPRKEQKPASGNSEKPNNHAEWSEDWREEDIQTRFAFYTYKDDTSVLYLSNVFVEETSRNHGFGTRILRAAEKVAETIGATTISLKVKQDSPANAWYRKNGYGYMTFEDGYDWLEKNLEYMKPNKQDWSEEDEKFFKTALWHISYSVSNGKTTDDHCDTTHWLKGVKERLKTICPSWKPSEEQMKEYSYWYKNFIESGLASPSSKAVNVLGELLEQLKKL